jgi:hypothetical protein
LREDFKGEPLEFYSMYRLVVTVVEVGRLGVDAPFRRVRNRSVPGRLAERLRPNLDCIAKLGCLFDSLGGPQTGGEVVGTGGGRLALPQEVVGYG